MDTHPLLADPISLRAAAVGHYGTVVRRARHALGLTLVEAGEVTGYSAASLSRIERGLQSGTDLHTLRTLARAFGIPPPLLGIGTLAGAAGGAPPTARPPAAARVDGEQPGEGEDPVRRREMIGGLLGITGSSMLLPAQAGAAPTCALDALFLGDLPATTTAPTLAAVRAAGARARRDFEASHYDQLSGRLPALIQAARLTSEQAPLGHGGPAHSALAELYVIAANLAIKVNDDPLAAVMTDRALQAATAGDDPLVHVDAQRALATVLRRTGRAAKARDLLLRTAASVQPEATSSPEQVSVYGNLLLVLAYTAAVDQDRPAAIRYLAEASDTARRAGGDANHRHTAFGPTNVTLYQLSVAQVLGDGGHAIEHARQLRVATIPTRERQGRYWIDLARAFHQEGRHRDCLRSLQAAEHVSPDEVRFRPPVRHLIEDLLDSGRHLPGLRTLARRTGVPA